MPTSFRALVLEQRAGLCGRRPTRLPPSPAATATATATAATTAAAFTLCGAAIIDERQQPEVPGALDRLGQRTLVLRADPTSTARLDFAEV